MTFVIQIKTREHIGLIRNKVSEQCFKSPKQHLIYIYSRQNTNQSHAPVYRSSVGL